MYFLKEIFNNYNYSKAALLMLFSVIVMSFPSESSANLVTPTEMELSLCRLLVCFYSQTVVMVISSIAIIFLAISVLLGKANWGVVVVTTVGIIVLSSAVDIALLMISDPALSAINIPPDAVGGNVCHAILAIHDATALLCI